MEPSTASTQNYDTYTRGSGRKKSTKELYGNIKEYVKEYCECSSIQGLSFLTKDISLLEGCWWAVVFAITISGCSYMVKEIVDKWNDSPVLVSLATSETTISKIPFPAVTICPETKISRQCVNYSTVLRMRKANMEDKIPQKQKDLYDYMAPLCRLENHVNSTRQEPLYDYENFLDKCRSVDLTNAFCEYIGEKINCSDILTPIVTDHGLCYTFNMLDVRDIYSDINQMKYFKQGKRDYNWDIEGGYPEKITKSDYPYRVFETGAQNSLIVIMLTKKSDLYASCQDFVLQGLKVSLHMPSTIPRPNQISFPAGLDELVAVSIVPAMTSTTGELKGYEPHKRYCYFEKERNLKYFQRYTQSNCNMECWTNFTIQECGCVHFYMPRDEKTNVCSSSEMQCLNDAEESYSVSNFPQKYLPRRDSKGNLDNNCDCLPSCEYLTYNSEVSRGKWNWNDPASTNARYLEKYFEDYHASAIKVFFKSSHFLPTEKSELYGVPSFLADVGGVLGLFLGISLFSFIEILYFLSVRLIENYRHYGAWLGKQNKCH